MEFHEKLTELRKQRGLTQEELAGRLFVSRTTVSKWESGRGYPNLDSLKAIAVFFSVTVDDLLSTETVLTIAEGENRARKTLNAHLRGFLDLSAVLLLFLPLFACRSAEGVRAVSRLGLSVGALKSAALAAVILFALMGVLTLTLQAICPRRAERTLAVVSLMLGALAAILFIVGLQPYAAVFILFLQTVKGFLMLKR